MNRLSPDRRGFCAQNLARLILLALSVGLAHLPLPVMHAAESMLLTTHSITNHSLTNLELRGLDGMTVRPLAADGRKGTLLLFLMHDCPVANSYAPEISRIAKEFSGKGIRTFIVYFESDLSAAAARTHLRDYSLKGGAVLDPAHHLVQAVGATISPEAAVVSPAGEIIYRGRIDDRVSDFGKRRVQPTRRDLRLALDAFVKGKPVPARLTKAIGCYIPDIPPAKPEGKTNVP